MIIRRMIPEDAEALASIEKSIFSQPWSAKGFLDALAMEDNIILVCQEEDTIAGYVCMYVSFDEGEITNVATAEAFRGRGFAKAMLEEILSMAKDKNISSILLEVRKTNISAIGLYNKMEFKEIGIRKNFYDFPKEDAIIMQWLSS